MIQKRIQEIAPADPTANENHGVQSRAANAIPREGEREGENDQFKPNSNPVEPPQSSPSQEQAMKTK